MQSGGDAEAGNGLGGAEFGARRSPDAVSHLVRNHYHRGKTDQSAALVGCPRVTCGKAGCAIWKSHDFSWAVSHAGKASGAALSSREWQNLCRASRLTFCRGAIGAVGGGGAEGIFCAYCIGECSPSAGFP